MIGAGANAPVGIQEGGIGMWEGEWASVFSVKIVSGELSCTIKREKVYQ